MLGSKVFRRYLILFVGVALLAVCNSMRVLKK